MSIDKATIHLSKGTRSKIKKHAAKEGVKKLNGEVHFAEMCRKLIDESLERRETPTPVQA